MFCLKKNEADLLICIANDNDKDDNGGNNSQVACKSHK